MPNDLYKEYFTLQTFKLVKTHLKFNGKISMGLKGYLEKCKEGS